MFMDSCKHIRNLTLGQMMQLCDPKLRRIPKEILEEGMLRHYFGDKIVPAKQRLLKRAVDLVCEDPSSPNAAVSLRKARDYVFIMKDTDSEAVGRAIVKLREVEGLLTEGHAIEEDVCSTINYLEDRMKEWGKDVSGFQTPVSGPEAKPELKPAETIQVTKEALLDELANVSGGFAEHEHAGFTIFMGKSAAENIIKFFNPEFIRYIFHQGSISKETHQIYDNAGRRFGKGIILFQKKRVFTDIGFVTLSQHKDGLNRTYMVYFNLMMPKESADKLFEFIRNNDPAIIQDIYGKMFPQLSFSEPITLSSLTIVKGGKVFEVPAMPEKHSLQEALRKGITEGYKQTESEIEAKGETVTSTLFEVKMAEAGAKIIGQKHVLETQLPIDEAVTKPSPLAEVLREGISDGYKQTESEMEAIGEPITSTLFEVKMAEAGAKIIGQKPVLEKPKRKPVLLEGMRKGYKQKVKEMKISGAAENTEVLVAEMSAPAIALRKPAIEVRLAEAVTKTAAAIKVAKKAAFVLGFLGLGTLGSYSIYRFYNSPPKTKQEDSVKTEEQRKRALYSRTVRFLRSSDPGLRQRAITEIEQRKDKRYVGVLAIAIMDEDDPENKKNAIAVLGELGGAKAIESLSIALKDKNKEVCIETAKALGKIGHFSAIPELVGALYDQRSEVRYHAAEAIGQIADKTEDHLMVLPAIEPLKKLLKDRDPAVRYAAEEALKKIKLY